MPNFRLTLAYDGTDFFGSQVQPNQRTIQGELESVLGAIAAGPVQTTFAGRTDRGVHAIGQIAAAALPSWGASERDLQNALNANLPNDMAASAVDDCDEWFNPRFDATWREYRYWIAPTIISPFLRRYTWMLRSGIAVDAVRAGASKLIGTHDFASFAGGGEGVPWSRRAAQPRGTTRTILLCDCREMSFSAELWGPRDSTGLEIRVVADGFLPRMVRNIAGALVEIGQGKQDPVWIEELLKARDRRLGPVMAPAQGLVLWRVGFGEDGFDDV